MASGLSHRMLLGTGPSAEGIDISMALAGEARDERAPVWTMNTKLDVPLDSGFKLTASVTWANREAWIHEGLVRGHFGLSYDLKVPGLTP